MDKFSKNRAGGSKAKSSFSFSKLCLSLLLRVPLPATLNPSLCESQIWLEWSFDASNTSWLSTILTILIIDQIHQYGDRLPCDPLPWWGHANQDLVWELFSPNLMNPLLSLLSRANFGACWLCLIWQLGILTSISSNQQTQIVSLQHLQTECFSSLFIPYTKRRNRDYYVQTTTIRQLLSHWRREFCFPLTPSKISPRLVVTKLFLGDSRQFVIFLSEHQSFY